MNSDTDDDLRLARLEASVRVEKLKAVVRDESLEDDLRVKAALYARAIQKELRD